MESSNQISKMIKEIEEIKEILKTCSEEREKEKITAGEVEKRARQTFLAHHPKSNTYKDLFIMVGIPFIALIAIGAISYYVLS